MEDQFFQFVDSCHNITREYVYHLWISVYQYDQQNLYSKPMPWIGMYIALASMLCVGAMVADLLHGWRNRKLWFPCKYFTLNAAILTVIASTIKLPMDLSDLMPANLDQATKLGSVGFMCTMMANFLPSLAIMDSKELLTNMIALGVLVITLVMNICIQINTKVLSYSEDEGRFLWSVGGDKHFLMDQDFTLRKEFIAPIYVGMLLMMLVIYACSSLAILKSKQILESKYQEAHQTVLQDHDLQQPGRLLTVEKLKQHVRNYWIMTGTGSPQFMTACSATTSASGVICALCILLHIYMGRYRMPWEFKSNYKWSMPFIYVTQFIGVILGSFSPLSRCFVALSFKLSIKWIWNYIKVYKVETYWTEKLYEWKQSSIPIRSRRWRIVIQNLKLLFLSICIGFQMTVVLACKIIRVIPLMFVIFVLYCFRCWKWLKAMFCATLGIVLVQNLEQGNDKDLSQYVLQLQDDTEFAERTLKGMSKSVNHLIQKAEKQQPNYLMKLLAESRGFEGVLKFDCHQVPSLLSEEYLNCWSLPLVTLTTIASSLCHIQKKKVDCLLRSVSEGLVYVTLVEENLNATDDHKSIQKVAGTLWVEVEVYLEWLGNKLSKPAPEANTATHILKWWRDTAKNMVEEKQSTNNGVPDDSSKCRSISANSMYRITETLILSNHANIDPRVSQEGLFVQISSMIADILAACLINLPRVIAMKCHASAIEKRVTSMYAAAKLLGETTQIINGLQARQLPSLNPEELAFIDKWRAHAFP